MNIVDQFTHPNGRGLGNPPTKQQTLLQASPARVAAILLVVLGTVLPCQSQTLGEALDAAELAWTTGGDAPWFGQTIETHDGAAAVQAGVIFDDQGTWIETEVTGPKQLRFWWKVSSESDFDFLWFTIDGAQWKEISGVTGWQEVVLNLPTGTHTLRWSYVKDGSVSEGADTGWLDEITLEDIPDFGGDFGEVLNATHLIWATGGDAPWFGQAILTHDGVSAMQSGAISDGQDTWMETTVQGPGRLSFWWKVSSESSFDILRFLINDYQLREIAGVTDWNQVSVNLPTGIHVLRWSYLKNQGGSDGADAGWVDEVSYPPASTLKITTQPESGTVNVGEDFAFNVLATDTLPVDFQWRFNGISLPGETGSTLLITNAQSNDSGLYDVIVSDAAGSISSAFALLNVVMQSVQANPWLEIRQQGSTVELAVAPDTNADVLYFFQGTNLNDVLSETDLYLLTNSPTTAELRIPLPATNQGRFFRAMRQAGNLEDALTPDISDDADQPFALWTLGFPEALVSGTTYTATFLLVVSTNALADYTGNASLSVVRLTDGELHPDAQIAPMEIALINGACRADVQVAANSSLAGYRVALTLTLPEPAKPVAVAETNDGRVVAASSSSLKLVPHIWLPDVTELDEDWLSRAEESLGHLWDVPSWSNPLPMSLPEVSGTFGEWRGHKRNGVPHANSHAGLDLVAAEGTIVRAARGGVVSKIGDVGDGLGKYVLIDHLDGWYSRYLHLSITGLAPKGLSVNRGDPIGQVGAFPHLGQHLHFELRRGIAGSDSGQPGNGVDPLQQAEMFQIRPPQKPAVITDIGVTPNNPASQTYQKPKQPITGSDEADFVVLRIRHPEPWATDTSRIRRLSPRAIVFQAEGNSQSELLTTPTGFEIKALKPASNPTSFGFARYKHGTWNSPYWEDCYRYWFRWDVSDYSEEANGPRIFSVTTSNYDGMVQTDTLKWGPQIMSVKPVGVPVNGEQRYQIAVRAWLGESADIHPTDFSRSAWTTGADWLQYELPFEGRWEGGNEATNKETAQTSGTSRIRTKYFWYPPDYSGDVTVRSLTVPAIAHSAPIIQGQSPPQLSYVRIINIDPYDETKVFPGTVVQADMLEMEMGDIQADRSIRNVRTERRNAAYPYEWQFQQILNVYYTTHAYDLANAQLTAPEWWQCWHVAKTSHPDRKALPSPLVDNPLSSLGGWPLRDFYDPFVVIRADCGADASP